MSSHETTPDPEHSVPRVSFGPEDTEEQSEHDRELQQENAETSLDQPST